MDCSTKPNMKEAALELARHGCAVFPLHTVVDGKCSCGKADCDSIAKHPRTKNGLNDATEDLAKIEKWWSQYPDANIGIATGAKSGVFVVDIDPKNGGDESLATLEAEYSDKVQSSVEVATGGGGRHFFFCTNGGLGNKQNVRPGIDVRGDGGYVVAPPSLHASGNRYAWKPGCSPSKWRDSIDGTDEITLGEIASGAPRWLVEVLKGPKPKKQNTSTKKPDTQIFAERDTTTSKATPALERCRKYLAKMPEAISGQAGHNATFAAACTCFRFGLSDSEARDVVNEYNARCVPPWSEAELEHKLNDAREAVGDEFGSMLTRNKPGITFDDYTAANDTCLELIASDSRTDTANGRRLVARCGNLIRYVSTWQKWVVWDGKRWRLDDGPAIEAKAKQVADVLWLQYKGLQQLAETDEEIEKMLGTVASFCRSSSSRNGINNMVALARSEPGIAITHNELDTDPWLLNVQNGVLELRSGTLLPHDSSRLITKLAPVVYDPTADCPQWRSTIATAMANDAELIEYQRRQLGMSLTGVVRDHVLPFWHGDGANGKSTIVEVALSMLGEDYAMKAPEGLLIAKEHDSHPTERADLFGKRLVVCNETQQGRRLNESLIKDLTGGDTISARRMREDFWRFKPTHKIIMFGNHKPVVRGTDNGIWRRLKLVPFNVVIAPEDQDQELPAKLLGELSGILNWCLIGCLEWQRKGLNPPAAVEAATSEYRTEQDTIGEFIADCCIVEPNAKAKGSDIYGAFRWWMKTRGEKPWSAKAFSQEITHRFDRHRNNGTWYLGIGVVSRWHEREAATDTTDSTDTFSG